MIILKIDIKKRKGNIPIIKNNKRKKFIGKMLKKLEIIY